MSETKNMPTADERLAALEVTVNQQAATIDNLSSQLEKATNPAKAQDAEKLTVPDKTFTVDKREFKFVLPAFVYGENRITALDALTDKEILADLVKKNSGVIQEIH